MRATINRTGSFKLFLSYISINILLSIKIQVGIYSSDKSISPKKNNDTWGDPFYTINSVSQTSAYSDSSISLKESYARPNTTFWSVGTGICTIPSEYLNSLIPNSQPPLFGETLKVERLVLNSASNEQPQSYSKHGKNFKREGSKKYLLHHLIQDLFRTEGLFRVSIKGLKSELNHAKTPFQYYSFLGKRKSSCYPNCEGGTKFLFKISSFLHGCSKTHLSNNLKLDQKFTPKSSKSNRNTDILLTVTF